MEYIDLLQELVADRTLPYGCQEWGIRSNPASMAAANGFVWPTTGWVDAPGPILEHNGCAPMAVGDGICVAYTWAGMATGFFPASHLLLVAFATEDVLSRRGDGVETVRLRRAYVVEPLDGVQLLRDRGTGAYLRKADLRELDLTGVDLFGADLAEAQMQGAKLAGASLYGANLAGAKLNGADLRGANLALADLRGANLALAQIDDTTNLRGANLHALHQHSAGVFRASFRSIPRPRTPMQ